MNICDAVRARRAVKIFDKSHVMPEEEKALFLELARYAPTAYNLQHTRFVVVEDKALRQDICEAARGQTQITDASLLIVICADLKAWQSENRDRCWKDAPQEVKDMLFPMIERDYKDDREYERDEAFRSIGIAAGQMMVTARAMDYDSCPMVGFDFDKVAELIRLPENHVVGMILAVGKKAGEPRPRASVLKDEVMVIKDRF